MKQLLQHIKTGQLKILETPTPLLHPKGLLVKNYFSAISAGTEKASIELGKKSLLGKAKARPDLVKQVIQKIKTEGLSSTLKAVQNKLDDWLPLGYSTAGEVISVGQDVRGFKVGDRVTCAGGGHASHAEIIYVPQNLCAKLPDNVSLDEAALTTIAAIALQGIRILNLTAGEKVGVIGLGLIGQLTVQILRAYGHPVVGLDIDHLKIKRALEYGLDLGLSSMDKNSTKEIINFTSEQGLDAVIITAATKSNQPIELAGEITRKKGRISIVGDVNINIPRKIYYEKELQITVSCSYGPGRYDNNYESKGIDYPFAYTRWTEKRNMEEIIRLMAEKKINIKSLITHTLKIDEALKAYDLILDHTQKNEVVAILLKYSGEAKIESVVSYQNLIKKNQPKDHINIGLIGTGNFTKGIILPALKKIKNISLLAAADTNGREASQIIQKFNGQYATTNYKEIINDKNIDLVIVATRHNLHAQIVIEALEKNKNVHVEKPLCLNEEELNKIIVAAQKSTGRLMVGFNRRFAYHTIIAKETFKNSQPLMIYSRMNAGFIPKEHWVHDQIQGGGRILGEACHLVDLVRFLADSRPVKVYAEMIDLDNKISTEDNILINIDFKNGSKGSIIYTSLGNKRAPKEYLEIFGDNQIMTINNFKSAEIYKKNSVGKKWLMNQDKGHNLEFKEFIESIRQGKPSPIPLNELAESTLITIKAIESTKKREAINL